MATLTLNHVKNEIAWQHMEVTHDRSTEAWQGTGKYPVSKAQFELLISMGNPPLRADNGRCVWATAAGVAPALGELGQFPAREEAQDTQMPLRMGNATARAETLRKHKKT